METGDDQVQLVLNTRSGTLDTDNDFSSCTWRLKDPVFLPSNEYVMSVSVSFLTIPGDHFRMTAARGTTSFHILSKLTGGEWEPYRTVTIPDNSYTKRTLVAQLNQSLAAENINFLRFSQPEPSRMCTLTAAGAPTGEWYTLACKDVTGTVSGAGALGFDVTSDTGLGSEGGSIRATRPPDTHGTRTVTIKADVKSQSQLDPFTLTRKRSVLGVIPAHDGPLNTPAIWDQYVSKEHVIATRCLDKIQLHLEDDMGLPLNPNNNWAVSLEVKFRRKDGVTVKPSRRF